MSLERPVDHIANRWANEILSLNQKPIVIAGNGPSLSTTDTSRIPDDALVVRINNFFFEERYFLGRNVDLLYVAGIRDIIPTYVRTMLSVQMREEYHIHRYCGRTDNLLNINKHYFPIFDVRKFLAQNKKIATFLHYHHLYPGTLPTSGMMAIFTAIGMGFENIYITGMDFYTTSKTYSHQIGANHAHLVGIEPGSQGYSNSYHTYDVDMAAFMLANSIDGVTIKSLTPDCYVNKLIELAPVVSESKEQEEKPSGYIKDFIYVPQDFSSVKSNDIPSKNDIAPKDKIREVISLKEYSKAIALCEAAVKRYPNSLQYRSLLRKSYLGNKEYFKAINISVQMAQEHARRFFSKT